VVLTAAPPSYLPLFASWWLENALKLVKLNCLSSFVWVCNCLQLSFYWYFATNASGLTPQFMQSHNVAGDRGGDKSVEGGRWKGGT
jgi:hypothetical protein